MVVTLAWNQSQEDRHLVLIRSALMTLGADNIKVTRVKSRGVQGGLMYRLSYTDESGRKTKQLVFVFTHGSEKDQIQWGDREIIGPEQS